MNYFCTYFDSNFLFRGLALFYSLVDKNFEFKLFVLCLDFKSKKILKALNYPQIILITLKEVENHYPKLLSAKSNRNKVEYFWTLTPHLPLYIIQKNREIPSITYLDADLFFYNTPKYLFDEPMRIHLLTQNCDIFLLLIFFLIVVLSLI